METIQKDVADMGNKKNAKFISIRPLLVLFVSLSVLTGLLYPLTMTGLGSVIFPEKVRGSLIERDGKIIGSELIGQNFTQAKYFWGRPSATASYPYNGVASGGSNQGPSNPALQTAITERVQVLREHDPENAWAVPVELVTASASGLDPHISPAAAEYQIQRVAKARGLNVKQVRALVLQHTEAAQWSMFGEARVHVLKLNHALDQIPVPQTKAN